MKKLLVIIVAGVFAGCATDDPVGDAVEDFLASNDGVRTNVVSCTNATALICSLTKVDPKAYGGWDGDCPGTDVDSAVFATMCDQFGVPYVKLENAQASATNVIARAQAAAESLGSSGGLLVLYFSGHGGQVPSDSASEGDGQDETICLWDGQLRDKHVWQLLLRVPRNVRVWMVTDCCNSGTNYRKPRDFAKAVRRLSGERARMRMARGLVRRASDEEPNLLHWGGCGDGESSFGSASGGVFTAALVDAFSTRKTYREWFSDACRRMPESQRPTCGETGVSFQDTLIFK